MNKVLYVARIVKKWNTAQLAKILKIEEVAYLEIENSVVDLTIAQAKILADIFGVDPLYFMFVDGYDSRLVNSAFEDVTKLIGDAAVSPESLRTITLGTKALAISAELNLTHSKLIELKKDNEVLKKIIRHYKTKEDNCTVTKG